MSNGDEFFELIGLLTADAFGEWRWKSPAGDDTLRRTTGSAESKAEFSPGGAPPPR